MSESESESERECVLHLVFWWCFELRKKQQRNSSKMRECVAFYLLGRNNLGTGQHPDDFASQSKSRNTIRKGQLKKMYKMRE